MSNKSAMIERANARYGKKSLVVATMLVLVFTMAFYTPISEGTPFVKKIRIGVIAPWSGTPEEPYGYEEWDRDFFKNIMEPDINAYLAKLPKTRFSPRTQIEFIIESAGPEGDSAVHLDMVKKFHRMGVNLIIGGYYTYLAADSLDYVNKHHMVMISPTATGTSLSIANDNLFRLLPDDAGQGSAIASLLEYREITKLIVIQQDDAWAEGIMAVLGPAYSGTIVTPVKFTAYETDLATVVDQAEGLLTSDTHEGVLLLAYEAEDVLLAATDHAQLMSKEWFGADATGLNSLIYNDALPQAAQVKLYSSMVTMTPEAKSSSKFKEMDTRFKALFPDEPGLSIYSANEIDAAWLLTLAVLETQNSILPTINGDDVARVLPYIASRYYGFSGWCELNAAGDRMPGNFEFWGYDSLGYHLYGEYNTAMDDITWIG